MSGVEQPSTLQATDPAPNSEFDYQLHSLAIGADYDLNRSTTIRANYFLDYYDDDRSSPLQGGVHTIVLGVSIDF